MVDDPLADLQLPLRDLLETGDHAQRGRLAAARRADEDEELAVLDSEVQVVDRPRSVGVDLRHTLECDPRHGADYKQVVKAARYGAGVHAHRGERRALAIALALVAGFAGVEALAGVAADSLALMADAAHMLSDALALGLALFAAWLALRPATPERSFGWRRAEVLAALANAVLLVVLGLWIVWAAIGRLSDPPGVVGGWVLAAGVAGLLVNLA